MTALPTGRLGRAAALFALALAAAAYFVLVELHRPGGTPAFDTYIYYLPIKLHAVSSLWDGGRGLLWNPYQSFGEPFFANPAMGLLYPPHLLFLVLEPNAAVHAVLIINMVIGATGMFFLVRELGLSWVAALGGALVFELGSPMTELTNWSAMHSGPWGWLPWALLLCERLLKAPTRRRVVALAVVLALELLPGWVLITALTYQLVILRVGWELITGPHPRPWRAAAAIAAALVLAPCLAAIQLVPAAELSRESFRAAVESGDFLRNAAFPSGLLEAMRRRRSPVPFMVGPLLVAGLALLAPTNRRLAAFYLLVGVLYTILALGVRTPLFGLYVQLPPGAITLKYPHRLLFISGLCLAMLTAYGVDAVLRRGTTTNARWPGAIIGIALAAGLYAFAPGGLRWAEAVAVVGIAAAVFAASTWTGVARWAACAIVGVVALNLVLVSVRHGGRLLSTVHGYWRYAASFAAIDPPIGAQDRVALTPSSLSDLSLVQKTATLLRLPDVFDYEALLGRRHIDYVTLMWPGGYFKTIEDLNAPTVTAGVRHRMFDLAAIRYVITTPALPLDEAGLEMPARAVGDPPLLVYRNDTALPRARYVPRIDVVGDPNRLLSRLAFESDDLAEIALVEEPMASGFTGLNDAAAGGSAHFVRDDPEHAVIDVDAPARGFLVLADQYYPGWRATVNGADVPIYRANYMFRLVEVPAGSSRVEFLYRPRSVALGAVISAAAFIVLVVLLRR
jgi:hypothetical protein